MRLPIDTCLQCGESRESVKANGYFCATLSGYETVEVDQEWDRHHWRDWSNAELRRAGLPEPLWTEHRRTSIDDLSYVVAEAICATEGHADPFEGIENVCPRCYGAVSRGGAA